MARGYVVAASVAALLVCADLVRISNQVGGMRSLFASQVLFHEDNSSWIALGTYSSLSGVPSGKFGYQLSILHSIPHAIASLAGEIAGVGAESWGASVAAVTIGYIFMVALVPFLVVPTFQLIFERTESLILGVLASSFFLFFLLGFVREVRNLGHYSAGVAVLLLVAAANLLVQPSGNENVEDFGDVEHVFTFALVLNLWFPLQPLSFIIALYALVRVWNSRSALGKKRFAFAIQLLFLPAPFIVIFFRRYLWSFLPTRGAGSGVQGLLSLPGATYETYGTLLLITFIFLTLALWVSRGRLGLSLRVGLIVLTYGLVVRFADAAASIGFDYGSTKLFWILIPALCILFFNSFALGSVTVDTELRRAGLLAAVFGSLLLLINSVTFYSSVRSFHPFLPVGDSSRFIESEELLETEHSTATWDQYGGVAVELSPPELPTICVASDGARPEPQWGFEPYRCTRKLAEASLTQGIQRESEGQSIDVLFRRFALLKASLTETIMGAVNSGNDLSRDVLILDRDGQPLRTERAIDYLTQVARYERLTVEFELSLEASESLRASSEILGNVDVVDPGAGRISGWVDPDVQSLVVVTRREGEAVMVDRTPRPDVAELLGAHRLYSGVEIYSPAIDENVRCIYARTKTGIRRLWAGEAETC